MKIVNGGIQIQFCTLHVDSLCWYADPIIDRSLLPIHLNREYPGCCPMEMNVCLPCLSGRGRTDCHVARRLQKLTKPHSGD